MFEDCGTKVLNVETMCGRLYGFETRKTTTHSEFSMSLISRLGREPDCVDEFYQLHRSVMSFVR